MFDLIARPWPWYVAGPLIGLVVPALLLLGGRHFGVSSNLRHICAACLPRGLEYFDYDWKGSGLWNLTFIVGVVIGGFIAAHWLPSSGPAAISEATRADLAALGIRDFSGLVPADLFAWERLGSGAGLFAVVGGGFLVGFGSRYAGGCTSGHAISGLADLQLPSLIAVIGFFVGGLITTFVLLPLLI